MQNGPNYNMNTEDFSIEIDEYEDNQTFHRLSIVKRFNINKRLFSPGSSLKQSFKVVSKNQRREISDKVKSDQ